MTEVLNVMDDRVDDVSLWLTKPDRMGAPSVGRALSGLCCRGGTPFERWNRVQIAPSLL